MEFKLRYACLLVVAFAALSSLKVWATDEIVPFSGSGGGGGVTAVTGTTPIASSGGTTPAISIPVATSSVNGYLTSTDWSTFNGRVASVSGTAPVVSSGGATPAISMAPATTLASGYLTSTDWATFNAKQAAGSYALQATAISTTAPLTGGGDLSTTRTLAIPAGTVSANGYLSSTDWSTFNGKAASGANADITSLAHVTKLYPAADSTAALQVYKADGSTVIATVDTTNKRLGIGSTTPAVALDVVSTTANLAGLVVTSNTNNATDQLGIMAKGVNANDSAVGLYNTAGGGAHWTFRANTNGNFEFIDSTAGLLDGVFQASTGNFGIGTGTPGAKLRVHGDHVKVTGTASTATVNANAGTGASCTVSNADDTAGTINLTTTGVASASGAECAVNFHSAYGVAPICVTTPVSANAIVDAVIQGVYFTTSTSALTVNFANTDAIGRTYNWSYMCIETQ